MKLPKYIPFFLVLLLVVTIYTPVTSGAVDYDIQVTANSTEINADRLTMTSMLVDNYLMSYINSTTIALHDITDIKSPQFIKYFNLSTFIPENYGEFARQIDRWLVDGPGDIFYSFTQNSTSLIDFWVHIWKNPENPVLLNSYLMFRSNTQGGLTKVYSEGNSIMNHGFVVTGEPPNYVYSSKLIHINLSDPLNPVTSSMNITRIQSEIDGGLIISKSKDGGISFQKVDFQTFTPVEMYWSSEFNVPRFISVEGNNYIFNQSNNFDIRSFDVFSVNTADNSLTKLDVSFNSSNPYSHYIKVIDDTIIYAGRASGDIYNVSIYDPDFKKGYSFDTLERINRLNYMKYGDGLYVITEVGPDISGTVTYRTFEVNIIINSYESPDDDTDISDTPKPIGQTPGTNQPELGVYWMGLAILILSPILIKERRKH